MTGLREKLGSLSSWMGDKVPTIARHKLASAMLAGAVLASGVAGSWGLDRLYTWPVRHHNPVTFQKYVDFREGSDSADHYAAEHFLQKDAALAGYGFHAGDLDKLSANPVQEIEVDRDPEDAPYLSVDTPPEETVSLEQRLGLQPELRSLHNDPDCAQGYISPIHLNEAVEWEFCEGADCDDRYAPANQPIANHAGDWNFAANWASVPEGYDDVRVQVWPQKGHDDWAAAYELLNDNGELKITAQERAQVGLTDLEGLQVVLLGYNEDNPDGRQLASYLLGTNVPCEESPVDRSDGEQQGQPQDGTVHRTPEKEPIRQEDNGSTPHARAHIPPSADDPTWPEHIVGERIDAQQPVEQYDPPVEQHVGQHIESPKARGETRSVELPLENSVLAGFNLFDYGAVNRFPQGDVLHDMSGKTLDILWIGEAPDTQMHLFGSLIDGNSYVEGAYGSDSVQGLSLDAQGLHGFGPEMGWKFNLGWGVARNSLQFGDGYSVFSESEMAEILVRMGVGHGDYRFGERSFHLFGELSKQDYSQTGLPDYSLERLGVGAQADFQLSGKLDLRLEARADRLQGTEHVAGGEGHVVTLKTRYDLGETGGWFLHAEATPVDHLEVNFASSLFPDKHVRDSRGARLLFGYKFGNQDANPTSAEEYSGRMIHATPYVVNFSPAAEQLLERSAHCSSPKPVVGEGPFGLVFDRDNPGAGMLYHRTDGGIEMLGAVDVQVSGGLPDARQPARYCIVDDRARIGSELAGTGFDGFEWAM